MSATEVVHAFRQAEPRLFIGAASVTVGLVVIGFLLIRRRFDRLLSFFAWFSILYGERLWMLSSEFGSWGPDPFSARGSTPRWIFSWPSRPSCSSRKQDCSAAPAV